MTQQGQSDPAAGSQSVSPSSRHGDLVSGNVLLGEYLALIERESPEERAFRLQETEKDSQLRRFKDKSLFIVALVAIVIFATSCMYIILSNAFSPETIERAWAGLLLIFVGIVGYLTGRQAQSA